MTENVVVLTDREHVLHRPDTYVGSLAPEKFKGLCWAVDGEGEFYVSEDEISPALFKICDEVLVNAADRRVKILEGSTDVVHPCTTIRVDFDAEMFRVWNDGDGIEVRKHTEFQDYWVPELIFGRMMTSTNFNDTQKRISGGRNGFGAKLANIFSRRFVLETVDASRKKLYKQEFASNMSVVSPPEIMACKKKPYTSITLWPDFPRFAMDGFTPEFQGILRRRVYDIACTAPPGCKVYLNGAKVGVDCIPKYMGALLDIEKKRCVFEDVNERWKVGFCFTGKDFPSGAVSFVNSISTIRGGTHVDYVWAQIIPAIQTAVHAKSRSSKTTSPTMIKEASVLFVDCLIENPSFDGQKKEELKTKSKEFGSVCKLGKEFIQKVVTKTGIVQYLTEILAGKENSNLLKGSDGKKVNRIKGIPKLIDAEYAGTSQHSQECCLILTEGDSAMASAVAGVSSLPQEERKRYGIFPLRGKPLNVREASTEQLEKNQEIIALKKILGLVQNHVYAEDDNSLRYGSILIYTDADADGSHIKGLLMNFFHHFWPSLLQQNFIYTLPTPIIKAKCGSSECIEFYHDSEYESWKQQGDRKKWRIKHYKGLGTSDREEARSYYKDVEKKKVRYHNEDNTAHAALSLAFEKEKANERKLWLLEHNPQRFLLNTQKAVSYGEFVHNDLIHFSKEDVIRSLPSVIDGLKPSQRKVIWVAFERGLQQKGKEIKVAQLAGAVSEKACYHHGEASLNQTIVKLSQDFMGSNNLNLLMPIGQFGTRLLGGKDAGAPRYIWTQLNPVTPYIFRKEDELILKHMEDDGQGVEPTFYYPVIPLVLLNGAEGIGTAWSCFVPPFKPEDIIANVRRYLDGEEFVGMTPWWRHFIGRVDPGKEEGKWIVSGTWQRKSELQLHITELPVGVWITTYKENVLEPLVEKKVLDRYQDRSSDTKVDILLVFTDTSFFAKEGWETKLKLVTSVSTLNMHLFPPDGTSIKKYATVGDILGEFCVERLKGYESRREKVLQQLERERDVLHWKIRFLTEKLDGTIDLEKKTSEDILKELDQRGYPQFDGTYRYITGMNLFMLTTDQRAILQNEYDKKYEEWERMNNTSGRDIWRHELQEVEAQMVGGITTYSLG